MHCVAFATISSALRIYKLLATPPDTTSKREDEYQMLSHTDRKQAVTTLAGRGGEPALSNKKLFGAK